MQKPVLAAMPTRIVTNATVFALGCIVPLTLLPAHASDTSAADRLEAARAAAAARLRGQGSPRQDRGSEDRSRAASMRP